MASSAEKTTANGEQVNREEVSTKVPQWLQSSLFEELLARTVSGYKSIETFTVVPALAPGENYATIMLRIEIVVNLEDSKRKTVTLMIKISHENEMFLEMMKLHNIFDVEAGMYLDIVPEMEQLYRDVGLEVKFGAESYKLNSEKYYILLEDLKPKGFKNVNRLEGLDMEHTKCLLKKLAQWHAASATRVQTKGAYPEIYRHSFFHEKHRQMMEQMFKSLSACFIESVKSFQGHELYFDALVKFTAHQTDEMLKTAKIDEEEFNVLNHGDCWSNNIMFSYDATGKIKETYLVDFQMPRYGSPAIDLYYFLLSSTSYDIKIKEFDYCIKFYYEQLIEHLGLLNYPKKLPKLREIHMALLKYGVLGLGTVSGVMGAVLLDPNENAHIDNFIGETDAASALKMLMFSNARYRKHAEILLPWLYNRGAIELN